MPQTVKPAFGRLLPLASELGLAKTDRFVGILVSSTALARRNRSEVAARRFCRRNRCGERAKFSSRVAFIEGSERGLFPSRVCVICKNAPLRLYLPQSTAKLEPNTQPNSI